MLPTDIFENKEHYSKLFKQRTSYLKLFIALCLILILIRLVFLQVINHAYYAELAYNNHVNTYPIAPTRGIIFDSDGLIIAKNKTAYNLNIIPERSQNLQNTVASISEFISIDEEEKELFFRAVKRHRKFDEVPLKLNITDFELEKFAVHNYRFPEATITTNLKRQYPQGQYFAHVLGYLSRISDKDIANLDSKNYAATNYVGKIGIEKSYENILHGTVGEQKVKVNAYGRKLEELDKNSSINGSDIMLTISTKLQTAAYDELQGTVGSIVAINPKTGAILAMASSPSYDPNLFINHLSFLEYNKLQNAEDKPLFNRAVRGQYPPASTVKPLMALKGLEENIIDQKFSIYDRGFYQLPKDKHLYRDWKSFGHGWTNLHKAIVESCDTFFYDLAFKLKIKNISEIYKNFGLGDYTHIDINEELPGLVPSPEWKQQNKKQFWFPGETLITGIGQGFLLATPLQLAVMTSILANHGVYMKPHLVKAIKNTDGSWEKVQPEIQATTKIHEENWQLINHALVDVIASPSGTAHRIADGLTYKIAGKTGTAQVFSVQQGEKYHSNEISEKLRDHTLFIGYAPADNPQIAVATIIENGADSGVHTSTITRAIIDKYFELKKNDK